MTTEDKKVEQVEAEAKSETPKEELKKEEVKQEETKKEEKTEEIKEEKEEKPNELLKEFSIEIKKEQIQQEFEEKLTQYAGEMKLPGFRKGKAPMDVVKARLKDAIMEEVVNALLQETIFKKIQDDDLKVISQPQIKDFKHEDDSDLTATVSVEILPEVEVPELETLEVEISKDDKEAEPYDEEKSIDRFLMANRRQLPVHDRGIQDEDMVMFDFQSKPLDTKRMTPRKSSNFTMDKEGTHDIMDLHGEMTGKKVEEQFIVKRSYPGDYKKKPWAGKEVEHYITVKGIYEFKKPELDEALVKSKGFEDEAQFKAKLKEEYENHVKQQEEQNVVGKIIEKLVDSVEFPVPDSLVQQEMSRMMQQNPYAFNMQGQDKEAFQKIFEVMKDNAGKTVRFSILSEAVKKKYDIKVKQEDLDAEYKLIAEQNGIPVKEVRKYYLKKENHQQLEDSLEQKKIMDLLKEKINVKEV